MPAKRIYPARVAPVTRVFSTRWSVGALAAMCVVVVCQSPGRAQSGTVVTDPLPYTLSYTVTGNVVAAGVDFLPQPDNADGDPGFQTETIHVGTATTRLVPANAELLAAWLYWETLVVDPSQLKADFRGLPVSHLRIESQGLTGVYAPCWSQSGNSLYMMRADVLMFFPPQRDEAGNPTGRRLVNDMDLIAAGEPLTTVRLPERGTGNQTPQSAGATLLMVYRDPAEPLRKIVVYDGLHVQKPGETTKQRLRGFLQSSVTGRQASLTQIIARGAANPSDVLNVSGAGASTVVGNEFQGSLSPNSDRGWANPTTIVTGSLPGTVADDIATATIDEREFGEQLTASVNYTDQSTYACHTWAAMALSTTVQDSDKDGLTDALETGPPSGVSVFKDPNGNAYPKLWTMGAQLNQKDMFVEVNSMWANANISYGSGVHKFPIASQDSDNDGIVVDSLGHDHRPTPKTLTMVGDALFRAGVRVHFDVGPLESGGTGYSVNSVFYPFPPQTPGHPSPASYFIDGAAATGGESILETRCVVGTDPLCQFPAFPGTVSWKFELQQIRDEVVDANTGRRRFDPMRHLLFHYLFFAHARGYAKSAFPCLNGTQEVGYPTDSSTAEIQPCSGGGFVDNPPFHVPLGLSGVSDLPGFNSMVALGLSKNFVGTEFFQASTTLHELGHSIELWHGGTPPIFTASTTNAGRVNVYVEPNCKPNYQSSMSYLHQLYGLIDAFGVENIDYSNTTLGTTGGAIDETALSDVPLQGAPTGPRYRTAWYAPLTPGTTGAILGVPAAKTHCDGTPKGSSELMGRLQSDDVTPLIIDWAGDGALTSAQDVNFDGHTDGLYADASGSVRPLQGVNDLQTDHIRLNQLGGGQNAGGFSVGIVYVGTEATVDAVPYPNGGDYGGIGIGTGGLGFGTGGVQYLDGNKYFGGLAIGTGGIPYITGGLPIGTGGLPIMTGGLGIGTGGLGFATGGFPLVDGVAAVSGLAIGTGGIPIATGGLAIGTGGLAIGTGGLGFGTGGLGFGTGGLYLTQIGGAEIGHNDIENLGHAPPNRMTACILGVGTCAGVPFHRHLLQWTASNLDSPEGFLAYRTMGNAVTGSSIVTPLTAVALPDTARSFIDGEELPDTIDFAYWTKALFHGVPTGPSILGKVTAINLAPTAVADVYTVAPGVPVVQGNLFANDTDSDGVFINGVLNKSNWTALLVNASGAPASAPAGLTFNSNGTFSYNTSAGPVTFFYKIDPGKWTDGVTDISPDSAVVSVTITVPDVIAPTVTGLAVTPPTIWSPNGKAVTVTITGTATDTGSGVASIVLDVEDEYNAGENRVNNPHDIDSETPVTGNGPFSVKLSLVASRLGSDKDGRKYLIYVGAKDRSGNIGWATSTLTVTAHDQGK